MQDLPHRLCAHRGFNTVAPENTLPAFACAVSLGAPEIEFDLWPSADGQLIVCHDPTVDRTTDGCGRIAGLTGAQLRGCDAGGKFAPAFAGTRLPCFEEILQQFAGKTVMNIHIKSPMRPPVESPGMEQRGRELYRVYIENQPLPMPLQEPVPQVLPEMEQVQAEPYPQEVFGKILQLIDRYHCRDSVYITGEKDVLETARSMASDLQRCCLEGHMNFSIVENALKYGCSRVQFCKLFLTREMIRKAHENGILCNLFWCDDPQEARAFFDMGIDVILTNDYLRTAAALQG